MTWSGTNSGEVRGYKIYIGDEGLTQITAYTEVGEVRASTNFLITGDVFEDLDNLTTWYIAVSPFDDDRTRVDVQPVEVLPPAQSGGDSNLGEEENTDFTALLTTPNLLAAGLLLIAVFLLVAIVRTRNNKRAR